MAEPKQPDAVFTPNSPPSITYVNRASGGQGLEDLLRTGLATKGALISISGPSKSGKTVLVERVVGDYLIPVSGAGIHSAADLWTRVMAWIGAPLASLITTTTGNASSVHAGAEAGGGLFGVIQGKGSASLTADRSKSTAVASALPADPVEQIREELAGSGFVLFIDDFHYIDREAQVEIARQLKYLASADVRLVAASVPFRGDDVVRSNHELQGRLLRIDIPPWGEEELV